MVYNGNEPQEWRRNFVWILSGHGVLKEETTIFLYFAPSLCFQVVVCPHNTTSLLYVEKVGRFRQGTASVDVLLDEVDIDRPATEPPSGARSPLGNGPVTMETKLGEGAFGVVWHVWDVSTGEEHALKEPSAKAISRRRVDFDRWREEARILGLMKHVK